MMLGTIDEYGFLSGTINSDFSEFIDFTTVKHVDKEPPTTVTSDKFLKWWWNTETKDWEEKIDYRGHYWYNPERTSERYCSTTPDDRPANWFYLPPNTNIDLSMVEMKERKWEEIKVVRSIEEIKPFECDGRIYDVDTVRIPGAVQLAMMAKIAGEPFSINWTVKDNSVVTLDADAMIAVGRAMGTKTTNIFNIGVKLRNEIALASTVEELDAIKWPE